MASFRELGCIGVVELGDTLPLALVCRNGSGVGAAPASAPAYSIYEPGNEDFTTVTGSLGASDHDSKTGFRVGSQAITEGNGFESGKNYPVVFSYTISGTAYLDKGFIKVT